MARRKSDPRTLPSGLGIDLSRKEVVTEVERLSTWAVAAWANTEQLDLDDVLAEVFAAIVRRNVGSCPFDPAKGAFSTYTIRIARQTTWKLVQRRDAQCRIPPRMLASLDTPLHIEESDSMTLGEALPWEGSTEQEWHAASAAIEEAALEVGGEAGWCYAAAKMLGDEVTGLARNVRAETEMGVAEFGEAVRAAMG